VDASGINLKAPLKERMQILKGSSFAIDTVSSLAHAYLRVLEKAGGIDPDAVPINPTQPQDAATVIQRKGLDGYIGNAPFTEMGILTANGVAVASAFDNEPPGLYPIALTMLMTRPQFCADRPDTCKRMAHALAAGLKYVHEDRKAAYDILKAHFPKFDDKLLRIVLDAVEKMLAKSAIMQEASIASSDSVNADPGF